MKLSVGLIGIILSARTAGHILAAITAGYLSDRIGRRPIIIAGMLIEAASLYVYILLSNFELFMLTGFFEGFG